MYTWTYVPIDFDWADMSEQSIISSVIWKTNILIWRHVIYGPEETLVSDTRRGFLLLHKWQENSTKLFFYVGT